MYEHGTIIWCVPKSSNIKCDKRFFVCYNTLLILDKWWWQLLNVQYLTIYSLQLQFCVLNTLTVTEVLVKAPGSFGFIAFVKVWIILIKCSRRVKYSRRVMPNLFFLNRLYRIFDITDYSDKNENSLTIKKLC